MNALATALWMRDMDTMPLSDLAVLSGISLPALSQYRSGAKPMSKATATRIAVAAAAGPESVILKRGLASFPAMGTVIKQDHPDDPVWCLRLLANGIQQGLHHLQLPADVVAFHNQPVHIAHPGWSALVGGAAILSWQAHGMPGQPWWVKPSMLTAPWSPVDHGRWLWQTWLSTPQVMRERNVIIGDGLLKAV